MIIGGAKGVTEEMVVNMSMKGEEDGWRRKAAGALGEQDERRQGGGLAQEWGL